MKQMITTIRNSKELEEQLQMREQIRNEKNEN